MPATYDAGPHNFELAWRGRYAWRMSAQDVLPGFGPPADVGKLQWCSGWTKGHAEAVDIGRKKCDACGDKVLSFGLPTEEEARWGGGCVKGARGGGDGRQEEVRGLLTEAAKFWTAGGGEKVKVRWCGGCVKGARGSGDGRQEEVRGLSAEAAKFLGCRRR